MMREAGGFLLLAVCVGLSYQVFSVLGGHLISLLFRYVTTESVILTGAVLTRTVPPALPATPTAESVTPSPTAA